MGKRGSGAGQPKSSAKSGKKNQPGADIVHVAVSDLKSEQVVRCTQWLKLGRTTCLQSWNNAVLLVAWYVDMVSI